MNRNDPRKTSRYQAKRAEFLRRSRMICHWCGSPVDAKLPMTHPFKATVDHLVEVDREPVLAMDVSLWVVSCAGCNYSRGARYRFKSKPRRRPASREW